jgi:hypothetical protein
MDNMAKIIPFKRYFSGADDGSSLSAVYGEFCSGGHTKFVEKPF